MLVTALRVFLTSVTAFLVAFYTVIAYFAFGKKGQTHKCSEFTEKASVIIPAYNEEGVVDNLLRDLTRSNPPVSEVIVLDDHSTDSTSEIARRMNFKAIRNDSRLGKAATLNKGAEIAKEDIIIIFDADNRPQEDCIGHLVRHFDSENTGIVTGATKILPDGFVSRLAALEFDLCFYLFHPFSSRFGFFPIVHGAYFAIRRQLAHFDIDALTEDFDISVTTASKGYRIDFEPDAVSYVSAAPSLSLFKAQRERWVRGAVQASLKHKGFSKQLFRHIRFLGLFLTALGYVLPLVWAATLAFLAICYFLSEFLLLYTAILAITVYTVIVFLCNHQAGSPMRNILALPFLGYFYFFFVVWYFIKAVVLEYSGAEAKFSKIPHRLSLTNVGKQT